MCWRLTKVPLTELDSLMFQGCLPVSVHDTSQPLSAAGLLLLYWREWKISLCPQNGLCNRDLKHLWSRSAADFLTLEMTESIPWVQVTQQKAEADFSYPQFYLGVCNGDLNGKSPALGGSLIPTQVSHSALVGGLWLKWLAVDFVSTLLIKPLESGLPWSRWGVFGSSNPWFVTNPADPPPFGTALTSLVKIWQKWRISRQKKNPKTPQDSLTVHGACS